MSSPVSVSREIATSPESLWAMVSDVTRMGEWSPENQGATWLGRANAPVSGAKFRGINRYGSKQWKTVGTVTEAEPGRRFAFRVVAGPFRVSEWKYTFEPSAQGCRVTETWIDRRGRVATAIARRITGVADRPTHNRHGMEMTLEALASAAQSATSPD
jgi:uncharacterized protein YndB with AHSA1/START domain